MIGARMNGLCYSRSGRIYILLSGDPSIYRKRTSTNAAWDCVRERRGTIGRVLDLAVAWMVNGELIDLACLKEKMDSLAFISSHMYEEPGNSKTGWVVFYAITGLRLVMFNYEAGRRNGTRHFRDLLYTGRQAIRSRCLTRWCPLAPSSRSYPVPTGHRIESILLYCDRSNEQYSALAISLPMEYTYRDDHLLIGIPLPANGSRRTVPLPDGWGAIRSTILVRDPVCRWGMFPELLPDENGYCRSDSTEVDHIGSPSDHRPECLRGICYGHHLVRTSRQANKARWGARYRPKEKHPGYISTGHEGTPTLEEG